MCILKYTEKNLFNITHNSVSRCSLSRLIELASLCVCKLAATCSGDDSTRVLKRHVYSVCCRVLAGLL